jgi:glycosyltransferase involved in cell wall biosynthesis
MQPKFSIIMPTFNSAKTLFVAMDSVLKQTFSDFEIIIVDGLSSDSTLDILKRYRDKRIKIFSESDNGIYDAMNKGVEYANGDWLFFMGSDDHFYEKTTLKKLIAHEGFKTHTVVYGNVNSKIFNGLYDGEFTYSKLTKKNICHQSIFFHKTVFKKIGKFNTKYLVEADWDHNLKWFFSSKIKHMYVDQTITNYGENGVSSKTPGDPVFYKEKFFKIVWLGIDKLSFSEIIYNIKSAFVVFEFENKYSKTIILFLKRCLRWN